MSAKRNATEQKAAKGAKELPALLNCPFCGSINIGFTDPNLGQLACECQECGAQGPFAGLGKGNWQKRAMKFWLTRYPADPRPAAAGTSTTPLADALLDVMNAQGRKGRKGGAK